VKPDALSGNKFVLCSCWIFYSNRCIEKKIVKDFAHFSQYVVSTVRSTRIPGPIDGQN
jgi:hypothetical protein